MAGNSTPAFPQAHLESLCQALADTSDGLTGTEIGSILAQVKVRDTDPTLTKWKRLFNALASRQYADQSSDRILAFIKAALEPARYAGRRNVFENRRAQVNVVLAFVGLEFRQDGKFAKVNQAVTLKDAEARANRLRGALSERGVHKQVLVYCRSELLEGNSFHAVLEATKGIADRLRALGGATTDGAVLVDEVLGGDPPRLRINAYLSESHKSEQRGLTNLVKGLFGTFRNPTAHAARIGWEMSEPDALDLFSLCSYVHRRLDGAS